MPFEFHIDTIDQIWKGIIIGAITSGLMGPVGVLCAQRTLSKGRWRGLVTGSGATCSSIIYVLLTGLGMSLVMDLITNPKNLFVSQISGSIPLLLFGIYSFRNNPTKHVYVSDKTKGTYPYNGITTFWLTLLNPLIILLLIAMYAQFKFVVPDHPVEMVSGYFGIFGGALLWWYGLTWVIDKVRGKSDNSGVAIINKIIGSIVIVCSIIILIGMVLNLYIFYYQLVIVKSLTGMTGRCRFTQKRRSTPSNIQLPSTTSNVYISQQLRKKSIVEYILYMWQVEDVTRVHDCSLSRIRREYIGQFDYTDEQKKEMVDWYGNPIRMMNEEGKRQGGHLQINQVIVTDLIGLHRRLLQSTRSPFYSTQYYKVLPSVAELRCKGECEEDEIQARLNALYGVMLLWLQQEDISPDTIHVIQEITTFIDMLSDCYIKDRNEGLQFEED